MEAIEIARKLAALGEQGEACRAYGLVIQSGEDPAGALEGAVYILRSGGDYRISYTAFINLYNQGYFREEILPLITKVFYEPNIKMLKSRYERNCRHLAKYPYLFRKDFLPFEELPVVFFPFDDHSGYIPFYPAEERFGDFVNFKNTVISRNFFKNLDNPILAADVYSQYELEYLNDNVRKSEDIGRENHIYLHYSDWGTFCSYLQCLSLRTMLESRKLVFLIGEEIEQYPIDFKARFGIDYSQYSVKPVGIREVTRMIWHTQLSTHNGGDFFNEVFDAHPNLIVLPSLMMSEVEETAETVRKVVEGSTSLRDAQQNIKWQSYLVEELYHMRDRTEKDIVVALNSNRYQKGDIIAFYYNNNILIKRVIASAGEWVDIDADGNVYVNDELLDEPYVTEKALGDCNITLPYQVPDGRCFVMGDHRATSIDSRNTAVGCVSNEMVIGKILVRVWPVSGFGLVN